MEKAIPWKLGDSDEISLWIWEAKHFKAQIFTDSNRQNFMWEIQDLSQGYISPLADGHTGSFKQSEEEIKETIGKSYPKTLGYLEYAGRFATTFTIFDGTKIDFGPLQAQKVIMTVRVPEPDGTIRNKKLIGKLSVENYHIKVAPEHGDALKVPPSRIVKIQPEMGGEVKPVVEEDSVALSLRIYPGLKEPGCTGTPGFMPGTVEHPGRTPRCPIHEAMRA